MDRQGNLEGEIEKILLRFGDTDAAPAIAREVAVWLAEAFNEGIDYERSRKFQ